MRGAADPLHANLAIGRAGKFASTYMAITNVFGYVYPCDWTTPGHVQALAVRCTSHFYSVASCRIKMSC
jgi:hypothetical protein